jgi:6-phosphogluconolactonase (cycloisomerase 2 family)
MTRIKLVLAGLLAMTALAAATSAQAARSEGTPGAVYVLTNAAAGNAVVAYDRTAGGALVPAGTYATGGNGTGALLGDQGSLIISPDGHQLFAVNAGSNSISEFAVTGAGLELVATAPSGGTTPVSLTLHGKVLYVVNAGGGGTINGFTVTAKALRAINGSTRSLGAGAAGAAQIQFSPDGRLLAVTEKTSSTIDTFAVDADGHAGVAVTTASTGATPFGFDFDTRGNLLVSNASGSASSYTVDANGELHVITGAVSANQTAPCWLVVGKSGRYAYTANGGSGTISRFGIGSDGSLTLLDPAGGAAASLGTGSHPLDLAVSSDGRFLYNLTDGLHRISVFRIAADGTLSPIETIGDLPVGAEGVAAA